MKFLHSTAKRRQWYVHSLSIWGNLSISYIFWLVSYIFSLIQSYYNFWFNFEKKKMICKCTYSYIYYKMYTIYKLMTYLLEGIRNWKKTFPSVPLSGSGSAWFKLMICFIKWQFRNLLIQRQKEGNDMFIHYLFWEKKPVHRLHFQSLVLAQPDSELL